MRILIIINEKAGGISGETLERELRDLLESYPRRLRDGVSILRSQTPEHARQVIRENYRDLDIVVAAGGDGTVTEVIAAILPYPAIRLGILPVGTANRLALNLGISPTLKGAIDTLFYGEPHDLDVGRINDRYFSLMAGAGLDAEIMADVLPLEKRALGVWAYFWRALCNAFRTPYAVLDIAVDGQHLRCRGIGVVIANAGNLLGPYFTLTPGAQVDDGLFDVCVLASRHRVDYWQTLVHILTQQQRGLEHQEGIRHLRGRHIYIKSRPKLKVQADGDVIGTTPLLIEAMPNAVKVMVPTSHASTASMMVRSIQHWTDHLRLVIRDLLKL